MTAQCEVVMSVSLSVCLSVCLCEGRQGGSTQAAHRQHTCTLTPPLTPHQVVQQRHDEVLPRAHGAVVVALEGADGVVAVAGAFALFVQPGHEAEGVVREEAAASKGAGKQAGRRQQQTGGYVRSGGGVSGQTGIKGSDTRTHAWHTHAHA